MTRRPARSAILARAVLHAYLSPHFDDAVYSCGGLIHRQAAAGERVVVVTLCAGEPTAGPLSEFAESLHARWGLPAERVNAARRAEDMRALQWLGAQPIYLDVPDCIYRFHPETQKPLYASEDALFGMLDPAEAPLVEIAAAQVRRLLKQTPSARVYAPLGIGRHVDHQLTRAVAGLLSNPTAFYEDYPYAVREAETPFWGGLAAGYVSSYVDLGEMDLEAHCRAVALYYSQLSSFWPDEAVMRSAIRRFYERSGPGQLRLTVWLPAEPG
jgi:LmbE family N-acetylglucosaminyl deacetylase